MVLVAALMFLIVFDELHTSLTQIQHVDVRNASLSLPLFDANTCDNLCGSDDDCPASATCRSIIKTGKSCGVCVCTVGYHADNGKCVKREVDVPDIPVESVNQESKEMKTSSEERRVLMEIDDFFNTTVTDGEAAVPEWDCSKFDCEPTFTEKEDEDPLLIRTSKFLPFGENNCTDTSLFAAPTACSHLVGGNQCGGGGRCLRVGKFADYCICPYQRSGTTCHIEKEGKCKETTGKLPGTVLTDHRYVNKNHRHVGSIVARHFAPSLEHCIRLCEWTGRQQQAKIYQA